MGHYDSSYAYDEAQNITYEQRQQYENSFKNITQESPHVVWGTLDDVRGQVLMDWANKHNYSIQHFSNQFVVNTLQSEKE